MTFEQHHLAGSQLPRLMRECGESIRSSATFPAALRSLPAGVRGDAMLDADALKFACDDARQRGAAVVELIHSGDRQALTLLQVYSVTTIAALSAAAAIYSTGTTIPKHFAWVAVGMALALFVGAILCMTAMWTARIVLPGREPDFWLWAMHPAIKAEEAYTAYLKQLSKLQEQNRAVNDQMATRLDWAKRIGVVSPFIGFVGFFLAAGFRI